MALADIERSHAHEGAPPHGGRYPSIVDAIGHTPLVEIPRMCPNPNVRLYAKLEFMNPTGSVKDRVAKALIEDLEASGPAACPTPSSSSRRAATPASRWP